MKKQLLQIDNLEISLSDAKNKAITAETNGEKVVYEKESLIQIAEFSIIMIST